MTLTLFLVGGAICLLNFFLSFLRVPLLRARGVPDEEIRWVSGFPAIGSLLVAAAVPGLDGRTALVTAILLILIDTGGLHWFLAVITIQSIRSRGAGRN